MPTILLVALGAALGWFAAREGFVQMKPATAAIAGGVGALVGGALLSLVMTALGYVIGAAIGVALALVLAQTAFRK